MTAAHWIEGILGVAIYIAIIVVPLWIELDLTRRVVSLGRGIAWLARWPFRRATRAALPRAVARARPS